MRYIYIYNQRVKTWPLEVDAVVIETVNHEVRLVHIHIHIHIHNHSHDLQH